MIVLMKHTKKKPVRRSRIARYPVRIGGIRLTDECKEWLDAWCDKHEASETDVVREALDAFRRRNP